MKQQIYDVITKKTQKRRLSFHERCQLGGQLSIRKTKYVLFLFISSKGATYACILGAQKLCLVWLEVGHICVYRDKSILCTIYLPTSIVMLPFKVRYSTHFLLFFPTFSFLSPSCWIVDISTDWQYEGKKKRSPSFFSLFGVCSVIVPVY